MPIEVSTLPGGGTVFFSLVAYVGLSFLAGQEIGEREIQKLNWPSLCEAEVHAEISSRRPPQPVIPERRCTDVVGSIPFLPGDFGRAAQQLCFELNNPDLNAPARRAEAEAHARARQAEDRVLNRLAAKADTQCSCAADLLKKQQMVPLAGYAGSARLYTPPPVKNLKRTLDLAFATPQCQAIAEHAS